MNNENLQQHPHHSTLVSILWKVANRLRGPYRPPQYRRVMLPLIVLARFDAILSKHTDAIRLCLMRTKRKLKEPVFRKCY